MILACIFSALFLRLLAAFLVALANELSVKESIFIAITWVPKAIVEVCTYLYVNNFLFYVLNVFAELLKHIHIPLLNVSL